MTKVSVFGEKPTEEKKPIEFVKVVMRVGRLDEAQITPDSYDKVQLLKSHDSQTFDIMTAWDEIDGKPQRLCVFLGHWNDGVL